MPPSVLDVIAWMVGKGCLSQIQAWLLLGRARFDEEPFNGSTILMAWHKPNANRIDYSAGVYEGIARAAEGVRLKIFVGECLSNFTYLVYEVVIRISNKGEVSDFTRFDAVKLFWNEC